MEHLTIKENANTILKELEWLELLINNRLSHFFNPKEEFDYPLPPVLTRDESVFAKFIMQNELEDIDRIIIAMALAKIVKPQLFDPLLLKNKTFDTHYANFGGLYDKSTGRFEPTLATATFLCYNDNLLDKLNFIERFTSKRVFNHNEVLVLKPIDEGDHCLNQSINLTAEYYELIVTGKSYSPRYSSSFPAKELKTTLDWKHLIVNEQLFNEIEHVSTWISHQREIESNIYLNRIVNTGYKCIFYGSPGTGKTLTAALLGKKHNLKVYRVDLSQLVSKYIGETEKNLSRLFDKAENRRWILFFDEAESLFSKRTEVKDSKDKYANQQTGYLLQRIENYNGLVILATNLKPNIDKAFSRRIQSHLYFPLPKTEERYKLWKQSFSNIVDFPDHFLKTISEKYELSGGNIKNIIQFAWLSSKKLGSNIKENHVLAGIKKELSKEGKSFGTN
ncbi:ATP-binding protein [Psychroflexus salis]|uniref:AAA+ ATPase domain-containing protein n=1 Tax=Psychroflexus salis TaxID=1526574 RepID=A0A917EBP1_9FLAO|nr:ATP-binding protein [Psychroflexus salis]GGE21668.1 hypothetical protein GCM10010831_23430 [Psychroflexus salis]